MTALLTEPKLERPDTDGPNVAHFFCIVLHERDEHVGLCGMPIRGLPATWRDVWCSVCHEIVNQHRKSCQPCREKWGLDEQD